MIVEILLGANVVAIGGAAWFLGRKADKFRADFEQFRDDFHDHRMKQGGNIEVVYKRQEEQVKFISAELQRLADMETESAHKTWQDLQDWFAGFEERLVSQLSRIAVASGASPKEHTHCVKCGLHVARFQPVPGVGNICLNCIGDMHAESQRGV